MDATTVEKMSSTTPTLTEMESNNNAAENAEDAQKVSRQSSINNKSIASDGDAASAAKENLNEGANKATTNEEDSKWHTVGIYQTLNATVSSYIDNNTWSSSGTTLTSDNLSDIDLTKFARVNLEPGTAYRFRLRAINSVGASDWSEVSSFKTCLPGFPGAPSAIKISKSSEGAHLTWEPPPSCVNSNEIVEYSVYLAVKPGKDKEAKAGQRVPAQLAFVRVYVGAANQCTVSHASLAAAHVDCSNKPAIIFRIAARNEKGYGPATQVRWLQDPVQPGSGATTAAGATPAAGSLLSVTRATVKPELGGATPNKRFKSAPTRGGPGGD